MKFLVITVLFLNFCFGTLIAQDNNCFGDDKVLKQGSLMPYTEVSVNGFKGYFLIDFGTTTSTIDINSFSDGIPLPVNNTTNQFNSFDFFGSWGKVNLKLQDHSNIQGIQQSGILGTDFLSLNIFTLDYANKKIYRSTPQQFCDDNALISKGFKPVSSAGYFSNDLKKLNNDCTPNIPTIPIKIGVVNAVAQIDPGYDDNLFRHAININRAFFKAIQDANIQLIENPNANFVLSTCTSVDEKVIAYTLPKEISFAITATDGTAILVNEDVHIFLKQTPLAAKSCGGIGTWQIPAAQLGASFLVDAQKVIFDPFNAKVWFYTRQ